MLLLAACTPAPEARVPSPTALPTASRVGAWKTAVIADATPQVTPRPTSTYRSPTATSVPTPG
ncbi:MAG: hypothetical protein MUD01_16810, partial [Chloroflexaceae bacterium]|nr:hypothetical protein [Chloroflexaceae bacterium]